MLIRQAVLGPTLILASFIHPLVLTVSGEEETGASLPLEPPAALETFALLEGLEIELVAAEPQVIDPIAIRFDERGRMWVVEMTDYPHGPAEGEAPLSRIRVLEDRDGDGVFETATTFADQLLFPTGLQPWKGGVIVTLAGEVRFLKDTTGDGRADLSESWFRGFTEENSQLRANHPTLGLDNQIYIANGLRGGEIHRVGEEDGPTVSIRSMDFRFDPRSMDFEGVSGFGQFGMTFDDAGNRFVCSNRNPFRHVVLEDRYIRRNPQVSISETVQDVAAHGEASRIFPTSRAWTTSTLHAGQFTAACGAFLFRGTQLPPQYQGAGFTCDPTGNLVHCVLLQPVGATFVGTPVKEGVEFLTSTDEWFRPVSMQLGPDGAMYVVDMYRAVIEHPQFMPEELKERPDLRLGDDRGRVYRVRAKGGEPASEPHDLRSASAAELVALLEHENAWQRETAHRLLLEQGPEKVEAPLRTLSQESSLPAARLHALWLLDAAEAIESHDLRQALESDSASVRRQALILAERWKQSDGAEGEQGKEDEGGEEEGRTASRGSELDEAPGSRTSAQQNGSEREQVRRWMVARAEDEDAQVRFQAALSLIPLQRLEEVEPLVTMAATNREDVWSRRAVTLAAGDFSPEVALALLKRLSTTPSAAIPEPQSREVNLDRSPENGSEADRGAVQVVEELFAAAAMREGAEPQLLAGLSQQAEGDGILLPLGQAAQRGLLKGWNRRRLDWEALVQDSSLSATWQGWLEKAGEQADSDQLPLAARLEGVELLALGRRGGDVVELALREDLERSVRVQAIARVAPFADEEAWQTLLEQFPASSPPLRNAIAGAVLTQPAAIRLLLDELEANRIKPQELGRLEANRLLQHGQDEIKRRAAEIFWAVNPAERQEALRRYQAALELPADGRRGREVFGKNCASCHRIDGLGVDVAPDIADSRVKTARQLLTDILQPNLAIDGNYIGYVVQTVDGRTLTGILTGETASGVTLKIPEGETLTLQRDEIELIRSTGVSLMPDGLEENISLQEMADLIYFIKNWRYLDGRTPLGQN